MLKKRLQTVASLVTEKSIIDIGTDHGYLIIDLFKREVVDSALAVEITKGPLDNVMSNINSHNISNVEFLLSDGMTKASQSQIDNYDAISICGMGGSLIAKILDDSKEKLNGQTLYLQPNTGEAKLRSMIVELGYKIVDEDIIIDNDIYYEVIKAEPGIVTYNEHELYFGPVNSRQKNDNFTAKYKSRLNHLYSIKEDLESNGACNEKIDNEISMLEKELV